MTADSPAYIALGSNLGDRVDYMRRALDRVQALPQTMVEAVSALYETEPDGGPSGQPFFFNAVARIRTQLSPTLLMQHLLEIEASLDRVRVVKDGPRTIDLDLLLVGDRVHNDEFLTLPHPRMHARSFGLVPICDLGRDVVHPVLQKSMVTLLDELGTASDVRRIDAPTWWSTSKDKS